MLEKLQNIQKIRKKQYTLKTGYSTTQQLTNLVDQISVKISQGEKTVGAFLDVKKAFDSVWHNYIFYKLLKLDIPIGIVKIIESFLSYRKFVIEVGNRVSLIRAEVPRGLCLSPTFFNAYTADMPVHFQTKKLLQKTKM